jgi:hypothetical protein
MLASLRLVRCLTRKGAVMNDAARRILDQETPAEQEARADNLILTFMLDEPYPWTVDEIGREFRDPGYASDAVSRLASAGLVHRLGEFVFPTRTARRAAELQVGTN